MNNEYILKNIAKEKSSFVLATVISSVGSSPSKVGSKMLIKKDGSIIGTVGGGSLEAQVIEKGLLTLKDGENRLVKIDMTSSDIASKNLICGGVVEIFIQYMKDTDIKAYKLAYERLMEDKISVLAIDIKEKKGLAFVLDENNNIILGEKRKPLIQLNDCKYHEGIFYDFIDLTEKLLICGGGHVGRAVAKLAVNLGFRVYVADSRKEFVINSNLPDKVIGLHDEDFEKIISNFNFNKSTYVIVVSPGHKNDLECAKKILTKNYKYFGLMGSKRKISIIKEELEKLGLNKEKIKNIFAPIGVEINAVSPFEIAVSILAEIIATKRQSQKK